MGLTNVPLTFQRTMDQILKNLNRKKCLCFFDDILVFSKYFEDLLQSLEEVLAALQEAILKIKYSKCKFCLTEITFLGHLINKDGVSPDPSKIETISRIKEPQNVTQVKSFIGLSSYYRKFIKNFSKSLHLYSI